MGDCKGLDVHNCLPMSLGCSSFLFCKGLRSHFAIRIVLAPSMAPNFLQYSNSDELDVLVCDV